MTDKARGIPGSCPLCGVQFTGSRDEFVRDEPVELDGGALSPLLAGRPVVEHPPTVLQAWVLDPCGCRVPADEWELFVFSGDLWFARRQAVADSAGSNSA